MVRRTKAAYINVLLIVSLPANFRVLGHTCDDVSQVFCRFGSALLLRLHGVSMHSRYVAEYPTLLQFSLARVRIVLQKRRVEIMQETFAL